MRIPFDVKFRPQIESGEYKVETKCGDTVRIVCWDAKRKYNDCICGFMGKKEDRPYFWQLNGCWWADFTPSPYDLSLVTPEPELSEFEVRMQEIRALYVAMQEQGVDDRYGDALSANLPRMIKWLTDKIELAKREREFSKAVYAGPDELTPFENGVLKMIDDITKCITDPNNSCIPNVRTVASKLLSLAREQFIKDGYVIEKKAFHDAVEKVAPEVMKEVSENVDKTNEELTEFEKELESFYNHHLQVCTYDNQGTVEDSLHDGASKLLALARKELCDQIVDHTKEAYENGKAEALKDLPRWKEINSAYYLDREGFDHGLGILFYRGNQISIVELKKLPGFKEDEK